MNEEEDSWKRDKRGKEINMIKQRQQREDTWRKEASQ